MARPQSINLSSTWLDTLHRHEEHLRDHPVAHSTIMLAITVERGNLLRQEQMNEERRPRRNKR